MIEINELLKQATRLINSVELSENDRVKLKDILCYLSEWRKNNIEKTKLYPQLNYILYHASRRLRTFGYNRLNNFTSNDINGNDVETLVRDFAVDTLYKTDSGFILDKLQKEVLDDFEEHGQKLFLSAPTSFGKTFLLREIIYRHHNDYANIVIVLPTVALLMEVTDELEEFNKKHCLGYSLYNSIYKDISISDRNIFILTPERVLRLLAIVKDIEIDFFFFDEIYKIDEDVSIKSEDDCSDKIQIENGIQEENRETDHRAVAFRLSLYYLLKRCSACYLAGPFIALKDLKSGFINLLKKHAIYPKEITFSPTLKREIDFHGKTYKFTTPFESKEESTSASNAIEKLVYIAKELQIANNNQAIVYCLYPAYTEKNARQFIELSAAKESNDDLIQIFLEHLRKNYSFRYGNHDSFESWDFVYALNHQTGIHNGKFPKYFQREIMQLFNAGKMSTLFCTSTIVEGVNTNAKTVVVLNNPSGKTDEGRKFLLLNINGRAGRYQHHFVGNIVYLTPKSIKLIGCSGISLDFKPYNCDVALQNLDLENIADEDLSNSNFSRKRRLVFNNNLLPDSVFAENRLIERAKQEKVLGLIIQHIDDFTNIERASIKTFIEGCYFEKILSIWAEIGEIKKSQIAAVKWFSKNYADNGYKGVLEYEFERYSDNDIDPHKFANETYRKVFKNVKDTIEYQLPRIISLFETLINRAFEIKGIHLSDSLDLSHIIRYFEIGAVTLLGTDMIEKGVPIITIKKLEKLSISGDSLIDQRKALARVFNYNLTHFDSYETRRINDYIKKYC